LRDSLSILESIVSVSEGEINYNHVADILGVVDSKLLLSFSEALIAKDSNRILSLIDEIYSYGYDVKQFSKYFLNHLRDLIVVSISKQENLSPMAFRVDRNHLREQAIKIPYENWLQLFSIFYEAEKEIRRTDSPRLLLEVTFLKMLRMESVVPLKEILNQISELKESLGRNSLITGVEVKDATEPSLKILEQNKKTTENSYIEENQTHYPLKQDESKDFSWEEFINRVEEESISLASFLRNGCSKEFERNKLTLAFRDPFSIQMVNREKNLRLLKSIAENFLGKRVEIVIKKENINSEAFSSEANPEKEKEAKGNLFQRAIKEPVIKDVLEIFPGKIVDVNILK